MSNITPENPINYGYGDEFDSIIQIDDVINQRIEKGIDDLTGSAVFWRKKEGNDNFDRIGVRILRDGSITLAHTEDL